MQNYTTASVVKHKNTTQLNTELKVTKQTLN
jgi:hypothetical protein